MIPFNTTSHVPYVGQSQLDLEANGICSDVNASLIRAIDSTYNMPLSEHVLYSSYESYDNIMSEQRGYLNEMMSRLLQSSDQSNYYNQHLPTTNSLISSNNNCNLIDESMQDYTSIENFRDNFDKIKDFSESKFDRIGQNLDDASGLTSRDAQMVQATLIAANQAKLSSSNSRKDQLSASRDLSSSSSTSSLATSNSASTSTLGSRELSNRPSNNKLSPSSPSQSSTNVKTTMKQQHQTEQVNSVVQSFQAPSTRNHFGGYLGKQQFYGSPSQRFAQLENKNIPRPQTQFKDKIDNTYRPFEPIIKFKPNSKVPYRLNIERDEYGNEFMSHPYETEIKMFEIDEKLMTPVDPIEPPDLNSTPIVLVDKPEQLDEMCKIIESQAEFAVDVEHHSYRSFQGITCLLQISTRTQDFVIDAISLRSDLYKLNRSFTDPSIIKVFHGADCDVLWLQRDFGVYVVNLFDTSRAAKLMKFAHLSLAYLLKHYCNVEPDKSYQLADWRERPLPLPMLQYARADTHYLLYIYDRLRNDLLNYSGFSKDVGVELLINVFERGREICLKRYEKPPFSEKSHLSVLKKSRSTFNAKQMYAFKELYAWRDSISRELDESVGYVLPNNLMIRIAEYLPREPQGITALCNPMPPTVKKYLSDIHAIILRAIDVPLDETSKIAASGGIAEPSLRSIDLDSINHKHDIAYSSDLNDGNAPNLLDKMHLLNCSNEEKKPSDTKTRVHRYDHKSHGARAPSRGEVNQSPSRLYNFLDSPVSQHHQSLDSKSVHESVKKQFVSPYQRYAARNTNN